MTDEVRHLFHEMADLAPDERRRLMAERRIPQDVCAEVESLLGFDSANAAPFTACVAGAASEVLRAGEARLCGPYRLERLLGRGGMGAVYLGVRSDGELQQKVAVKLLSAESHRPGWRERFLRERQLLASLNHPSIVHAIDAGHTGDGRPFLVMEYVEGTPIDVYAAGIGLRDRLTLFLGVCEGISHAHRHLIIHRDLKPSNIVVDASGRPKLLDFGIAKLLDETGEQTQTGERLLTPDYASPEQLRGTTQSTATDIYSLGAVLYKLLTGRSPNELDAARSQVSAARPGEIPPPSRLNREVPADLDSIVGKALRNEPEERYVSAEAFAGDIRAFLESKPVEARRGNRWYRARKFVRRYWAPVAVTMMVVASLSAALYVANRERVIAQRRFVEVRQLADKLFDIDASVRDLAGSAKPRQMIVDTSLEYLRQLAADAAGDPEIDLELGNAYMRVARVQGVPISPSLGHMDQAAHTLDIADRFIQSVLAVQPANRTALLRAAQIAHDRMILARLNSRYDDAVALARKSAAYLARFNAGKRDEPEATAVLTTYMNVAQQLEIEEHYDESLPLCRRGLDLSYAYGKPSWAGNFLWVSAELYQRRGDLDEALQNIRESVKLLDPGIMVGRNGQTMNYVLALVDEGQILGVDEGISLGRPGEAAGVLQRAFQIADQVVHRDQNDAASRGRLGMAGIALGDILRHSDPGRALAIYDHTLRHMNEISGNASMQRFAIRALAGSSYPLRSLGHAAEGRRRLDEAFELLKQAKLYPAASLDPGSQAEETLRALADFQAGSGDMPHAAGTYRDLLARTGAAESGPAFGLEDAAHLSAIFDGAAAVYRRAGQADAAYALETRRLALWRQWDRKLPNNAFIRRQLDAAQLR